MDKESSAIRFNHWLEIINEANQSGMSRKKWCATNGIPVSSFFYWQRRIRKATAEKLMEHPYLSDSDAPVQPQQDFFEVSIPCSCSLQSSSRDKSPADNIVSPRPSRDSAITLHYGRFSLDISEGFSKTALQSVLEVISGV